MILKQGQEVRDAADPSRIGIVVRTDEYGRFSQVFWYCDDTLTWTSYRPVIVPRSASDVLANPEVGDRRVYSHGEVWTVTSVDDEAVAFSVKNGSVGRYVWCEESADDDMTPFVSIPHNRAPSSPSPTPEAALLIVKPGKPRVPPPTT